MRNTRFLSSFFVLLLMLGAQGSIAAHVEGVETNVVMFACLIHSDAPNRIDVVSSSANMTSNPVPTVSRYASCAQTLHELMTAGFRIERANLEDLIFVFVMTREDESVHKH